MRGGQTSLNSATAIESSALKAQSAKIDSSDIKIFGIDGNDMDSSLFFIPKKYYKKVDLTLDFKDIVEQVSVASGQKKFDLVQSLEVAEHLYAEYAGNFIDLLCALSDVVLFSAAIPHQGGDNHFNEQPPGYWDKFFKKNGFVCFDFREKLWENTNIDAVYRQNILFYVHKDRAETLRNQGLREVEKPMHIVIPDLLEWRAWERDDARNKLQKANEKIQSLEYQYHRTLRYYLRHPKKILKIFSKGS